MFNFFRKKPKTEQPALEPVNVSDGTIVAMADGNQVDLKSVPDEMFAHELMGKTIAFKYPGEKVVLCAPANGTLSVLFPTGHAYGIKMNNGTELLVHCGVNTVEANGDGFRLLGKKQGDPVKAGDPIVEVDLKKLGTKYDMSTMLIVTSGEPVAFPSEDSFKRGQMLVTLE